MNAAARVVTNTGKYNHGLSYLMHTELHWLDVKDRIQFRTGVMVYKCLHGLAPTLSIGLMHTGGLVCLHVV